MITEAEVLARAAELPGARAVGEATFAPLLSSPLLIAHLRSAGGAGGRRIRAGVVVEAAAFAVLVEQSGHEHSLALYAAATACAQAYGAELQRAERDGLGSRPEPAATGAQDLIALADALIG